ncbi:hypothetical protein Dsin_002627 [Dipteronia sinensis]|uniref:Uncharacterized protein n=1 Tax=Dipteronia sinensis TaxID=43782 RepID=A0AAE0B6J8_9ROSI|nr:hypothetical protein Dsin_002627 [Dipteronia sinensis]
MMRPNNNAVIISYYVESPAVRSHLQKMKRQSFSKNPQTRKWGSDRRSGLLAYANDLRKTGSQQINPPGKRSTSKPKCTGEVPSFVSSDLSRQQRRMGLYADGIRRDDTN